MQAITILDLACDWEMTQMVSAGGGRGEVGSGCSNLPMSDPHTTPAPLHPPLLQVNTNMGNNICCYKYILPPKDAKDRTAYVPTTFFGGSGRGHAQHTTKAWRVMGREAFCCLTSHVQHHANLVHTLGWCMTNTN